LKIVVWHVLQYVKNWLVVFFCSSSSDDSSSNSDEDDDYGIARKSPRVPETNSLSPEDMVLLRNVLDVIKGEESFCSHDIVTCYEVCVHMEKERDT